MTETADGFPRLRDTTPRPPKRRKPIPPKSERARAAEAEWQRLRAECLTAASWRCQMPAGHHHPHCDGHAFDAHHVRPRSLTTEHRLVALSRPCHTWTEDHPAEAAELGMLDIRQ